MKATDLEKPLSSVKKSSTLIILIVVQKKNNLCQDLNVTIILLIRLLL